MKRLALIAVLLAIPAAVRAQDSAKITVGDANSLAAALRNLDGHVTVIKQNGQDATVMTPWEFGNGSLRLRIASDLNIAVAAEKVIEASRVAIIKEILKRMPEGTQTISPGSPEADDFQRQMKDVLAQPSPGSQDLARIKASELKLDKNEIPITVLSALAPILDMDVK